MTGTLEPTIGLDTEQAEEGPLGHGPDGNEKTKLSKGVWDGGLVIGLSCYIQGQEGEKA